MARGIKGTHGDVCNLPTPTGRCNRVPGHPPPCVQPPATPVASDDDWSTPVAWHRAETDPCERGTAGCSVDHTTAELTITEYVGCETW